MCKLFKDAQYMGNLEIPGVEVISFDINESNNDNDILFSYKSSRLTTNLVNICKIFEDVFLQKPAFKYNPVSICCNTDMYYAIMEKLDSWASERLRLMKLGQWNGN